MTPADDLWDLCAAAVDGRLTDADAARLEARVLADPAARTFYVEFAHQHAALAWAAADPAVLCRDDARGRPTPPAVPAGRSLHRVKWAGWAVAAGLLLAVGWRAVAPAAPLGFARLADVKAAKWDGGTLPTEEGARLGAGRLRLAEGLARVVFDTGAELRLEGPAELQLVDGGRCVLHEGRLVAKVPEPAHGFRVDTPTARLLDLGTEFGVSVRGGRTSDVQVFDGRVDVTHRGTGRVEKMLTGRSLRFDPAGVAEFDPRTEAPPADDRPPPADGEQVLSLTTAMGRGKDAYVQPDPTTVHQSDILMLVKRSSGEHFDYNRRGYVGIDLAPLAGREVRDASLNLTLAATGMGFASEVPDCRFSVYGVTDESLDGWDERAARWATAPANQSDGPDPARTVLLGRFEVAQGVNTGGRSVAGPALVDFLKRDTNGLATFVVVRDTLGSGRQDLVHGFATKRHPTLPPPTLRVTVR